MWNNLWEGGEGKEGDGTGGGAFPSLCCLTIEEETVLEDSSSSEEEGFGDGVSSSIMSKRNKMDYCAARRRKVMAEKEMGHHSWQQPLKKAGGISDELLTNLEEKYGNQGKKKNKTMSRAL